MEMLKAIHLGEKLVLVLVLRLVMGLARMMVKELAL
jgi:hypothetical protein